MIGNTADIDGLYGNAAVKPFASSLVKVMNTGGENTQAESHLPDDTLVFNFYPGVSPEDSLLNQGIDIIFPGSGGF
jgi:hypothetical protein